MTLFLTSYISQYIASPAISNDLQKNAIFKKPENFQKIHKKSMKKKILSENKKNVRLRQFFY